MHHTSKKCERLNEIREKDIALIPEILFLKFFFENKDCGCRNACIINNNEEEKRNILEKFWGLADFNKQNVLLHEAIERKIVERRRPTNGKGSPRNFSFRYLLRSRNGKIFVYKKNISGYI